MFHSLPILGVIVMAAAATPDASTENPPRSVRIPLGVAIGLLPSNRRKVAFILTGCIMPFVIELIQMQAIVLDRACQSSDVADNLTGFVVGLVVGVVVGRAVALTEK